jgi:hypothetical protein
MSKVIALDKAEANLLLAEPIINSIGQTLINSGIALTTKHLSLLRTWNIQYICVIAEEGEEASEISELQLEQARENLIAEILWLPRNQAEQDIIELGVLSRAFILKEYADAR